MISIIVPVYNTAQYLPRCIDSILAQTFSNFEAIFVDDGSKDGSGKILDNYEKKDARIRVFHQENQGVSKARAFGVDQAKGEWVTFVDSDDFIPHDALEGYMELADDTTDIIIGWLDKTMQISDKIIEIEDYRSRCISGSIHVGPPTHTYRKTILSSDAFNFPREITRGEDMLMNIFLSFKTEKPVKVLQRIVYYYDTSVSTSAIHTTKITMEYEELFHSYRLKVIPTNLQYKYIKESVGIRCYAMIRYIKEHPWESKWRQSGFYHTLVDDIQKYHYPLSKSHQILLYSACTMHRWLILLYIYLRFDLWK